ncbi:hypothetical protein HJG60_008121 [Phyllostomus discolor]|uniref:Uncharacterized protein n=1 Tax=Phyllostomus discolor TaxID=89673 RepID=A0A833ZAT5_9CHIR|nr:hypothetical protein HJG60_008121 [Phyllostomus discolor]
MGSVPPQPPPPRRRPGTPLGGVCKRRARAVETLGASLNGAVTMSPRWDLHPAACGQNGGLPSFREQDPRASLGAGRVAEVCEAPACLLSDPGGFLSPLRSPPVAAAKKHAAARGCASGTFCRHSRNSFTASVGLLLAVQCVIVTQPTVPL